MFVYYTCKRNTESYFKLSKYFNQIMDGAFDYKNDRKQKYYTFRQEIYRHSVWETEWCNNTISLNIEDTLVDPECLYHTFSIPKRTGGYREICAPVDELKIKQTEILNKLKQLCPYPHEAAYAYVEERSTKDAMEKHLKNKSHWYLKLDLHGFFPSCTRLFVMQQLDKIYPFYKLSSASKDLIRKYCFKDGALPQGAPTSPYLSNIIMIPIDYDINKYCMENNLVYTRYADDIIISGYNKFDWRTVENFIKETLPENLQLNTDKTRFGSASGRNWNLGLMVTNDKITVGNQRKRRLKQALYNYQKTKNTWELNDLQHLLGELQYVIQIEPDIYDKMFKPKFGDVRQEIINQIKALNI